MENENMKAPEQNNIPHTEFEPQKTIPDYPFTPPEWTKNIRVSDKQWDLPDNQSQPVPMENTVMYAPLEQNTEPVEPEEPKPEMPMWKQILIIVVGIIGVILMFFYVKSITDKKTENTTETTALTTQAVYVTPTMSTMVQAISSSEQESASGENSETVTASEAVTDKSDIKDTSETEKDKNDTVPVSEQKAEEEIIKYYNDSINRVKPEAVKIVKNFENRTHNADKLELPSVIKSIGEKMLNDSMSDITEPIEYATAEEIAVNFPIAYESFSSKLSAEDVKSAVCTDAGNEYEITIVLETTVDPEPGKGAANAVDCINAPAVRDTAPEFVTNFSVEYYECVIRCRADKDTGRIIWANYTTPVLVKMGLDAGFTQFDAQIGLTFEKDYSVIY